MKYTQVKEIYQQADEFGIDARELIEQLESLETDFEVANYRFIAESEIDEIMANEMESDPYILGCFNAWFIADNTDLSLDIVEALQAAEKSDAIGQHIIDNNQVEAMQTEYASADGYGHHFSSYDGETHEDLFAGSEEGPYYGFRVN